MLSIHPEVQDFGDEDEKNYETGRNKRRKHERILQNTTSKPSASFVDGRTRKRKLKTYLFHGKTSMK